MVDSETTEVLLEFLEVAIHAILYVLVLFVCV